LGPEGDEEKYAQSLMDSETFKQKQDNRR